MPPSAPRKDGKPLLRLRSHFAPLVVLSRHPIRLFLMVLLPAAALPEMQGLLKRFLGFDSTTAALVVLAVLAVFILLPPLVIAAFDCRSVRYDFHADHLVFTENFFLRDKIRVPYKTIRRLIVRQSFLQRLAGIGNIALETAAGAKTAITVPDIRHAQNALRRIQKIIDDHQEDAQRKQP